MLGCSSTSDGKGDPENTLGRIRRLQKMSCKLESTKDVLITIDIRHCGKISPDM